MKKLILLLLATIVALPLSAQYKVTQEHKDRAAAIVKKMTLDEKISYIAGHNSWYVEAIDRLGLPAVRMADGPQGVRNNTKSTLYPSGVAAAATWDTDLIQQMGVSLGKDSRARGVHILLGPGANIYRSPLCGRNFEYFGEDPFLAGEIATAYIKGVQSMGVMACIKHFAGNNQEWARHSVSSDIDERTLNEIYFPAFEKAVKEGNVATIMTSYNLLNGVHASESQYLNQTVLRDWWGFNGFVTTDACMPGGFMDASLACRNGNDLMLDMGLGGCAKSVDEAYKEDPAGVLIGLRECAHNVCYAILNYTTIFD